MIILVLEARTHMQPPPSSQHEEHVLLLYRPQVSSWHPHQTFHDPCNSSSGGLNSLFYLSSEPLYIHTTHTHTCMYVCMHACVHTHIHTHTYVCMYACMHACVHTHTFTHTLRPTNIHIKNGTQEFKQKHT